MLLGLALFLPDWLLSSWPWFIQKRLILPTECITTNFICSSHFTFLSCLHLLVWSIPFSFIDLSFLSYRLRLFVSPSNVLSHLQGQYAAVQQWCCSYCFFPSFQIRRGHSHLSLLTTFYAAFYGEEMKPNATTARLDLKETACNRGLLRNIPIATPLLAPYVDKDMVIFAPTSYVVNVSDLFLHYHNFSKYLNYFFGKPQISAGMWFKLYFDSDVLV